MEAIKTYLKEIKNIQLLTAEEEITLSKKIRAGDEEARAKMVRANLRLVISIAKRYLHLGLPIMDLIEEGNMGLLKAVGKFNPHKGYRFSTYAAWWIKQSIMRALSEQGKTVHVPVYMNELIAKYKKIKEQLSQDLRRQPTVVEIARKMKLPEKKISKINMWITKNASLDTPVGEEGEDTVLDMIEDKGAPSPDEKIKKIIERENIDSLLDMMLAREREVLDLIDGTIHTLAEVAKKMGVSRERIRQIEEAAIKKLRRFVKIQEKEKL